MTLTDQEWPDDCHTGIEGVIAEFKRRLPGWWYSLGECQVSCDASCAPTALSPDLDLIPGDERFNSGFHADLRQPSTLAEALRTVMNEALIAIREPGRIHVEASFMCTMDGEEPVSAGLPAWLVEDIADQYSIQITDWRPICAEFPLTDEGMEEREARVVLSLPVEDANRLLQEGEIVMDYGLRQADAGDGA